jgi:hypothetical protein
MIRLTNDTRKITMSTWDVNLICNIIEGAIACFSHAHPECAIPKQNWRSISKRAARTILNEHRKRFGSPVDRLVVQHVARHVMRLLERSQRRAA